MQNIRSFFFILLSWFVAWHKYYISYINYCRALYTLLQSERNLPKRGVVPKGGGAIEKLVAIVLCCNCTFVVFCCLFLFCHHTLSSYFFTFKLAFLAKRGVGKSHTITASDIQKVLNKPYWNGGQQFELPHMYTSHYIHTKMQFTCFFYYCFLFGKT